MRLVTVLLVGLCVAGCGLIGRYANTDTVTIVNNTTSSYLTISVNGSVEVENLPPGKSATVLLYGVYSRLYGGNAGSITAVATDEDGDALGAAAQNFWVGSYTRQSWTWIINTRDLTMRE